MGWKDIFKAKKIISLQVTEGKVAGKFKDFYSIYYGEEHGIVMIDDRKYYFLGASEKKMDEISAAKALGGAAVGTVLAPGLGTLIGGAIGAKKKKKTTVTLVFMDVETHEKYMVEGTLFATKPQEVMKLEAHPIAQELTSEENTDVETKASAADEIRKFKSLLDDGIITEEEFNKKKQELLS